MKGKDKYRIFLSPPHQSGDELSYLKEVLDSNWLAPGGSCVKLFESKLKAITNRSHCVALNSGTAAIHLALKTLGIGPGDYVICQTFSFVATANPIAYLGAYPVFIDSETETWNMDPVLLERAIIELRKKNIHPKAIVYAHIYGMPAKVDQLIRISTEYQIPLVEDAAEALGSKIGAKSIGQFGKISILSFNGNKVITTSGGGAMLTDDDEIAKRSIQLATQARNENEAYTHTEVGYNYRMSNLSAALGLAQLSKLKIWVKKKRKIFEEYKNINSHGEIINWIDDQEGIYSNRWLSVFLFRSKAKQEKAIVNLIKNKIECRRVWKPLHQMRIYEGQESYNSGIAEKLFEMGICLPCGVGLKNGEQEEIIRIVSR